MILKCIRTISLVVLLTFTATMSGAVFAANDSMIELLKVLRDNGTITEEAFNLLKNSAQADAERTDAKIEETAEEKLASVKKMSDNLKWAEKIKLKGDLRLRYQSDDTDLASGTDPNDRDRYRFRYRLGVEGQVTDTVTVGAGFASGGDDPRSTNETLDDSFETKDTRLDYAYAEWKAADWVQVVGGKFKRKNYLWNPTDLIWDSDINPEGVSVHLENSFDNGWTAYGNAGHWILDEFSSSNDDPSMTYAQVGGKFKQGNFFGNAAGSVYRFSHIEGESQAMGLGEHSSGGNTLNAAGEYEFDYDAWAFSGELGMKDVFMPGKIVAVFVDYVKNSDSDEDTGYAFGAKFGDPKVKGRHQWQVKYIYADLEEDAWLDIFPDSDRLGGATGLTSHEISFKYGLSKNIYFAVDYYDSENEQTGNLGDEEKILQLDTVFKF